MTSPSGIRALIDCRRGETRLGLLLALRIARLRSTCRQARFAARDINSFESVHALTGVTTLAAIGEARLLSRRYWRVFRGSRAS